MGELRVWFHVACVCITVLQPFYKVWFPLQLNSLIESMLSQPSLPHTSHSHKASSYWSAQDSNLESPAPEADALSIGPTDHYQLARTKHHSVKTFSGLDATDENAKYVGASVWDDVSHMISWFLLGTWQKNCNGHSMNLRIAICTPIWNIHAQHCSQSNGSLDSLHSLNANQNIG